MANEPIKNPTPQEEKESIEQEFRERFTTLILGGFGIVAALAWDAAIKSLFHYIFGDPKQSLIFQFLYAVIVTVIVVLVSFWLRRLLKRPILPRKKG